jgi:DNA-binding NtrC family response regulator
MNPGLESTAREESHVVDSPRRLVLEWVWPKRRRQVLQGARLGLGRDPAAAIALLGSGVSRAHAELYRQGPLYVLHDLGSTNGTWLGGRRIEHAPVGPGSVLRVGDWVGVFVERGEDDGDFGEQAPGLFGGPEVAAALEPLRRAVRSSLPVSLIGATGTGKERAAHAAHHFSGRSGPFVAVNCAALPEQLAEAELFGYRRGAFTGAERASLGHFRAAHGGTLFLDEMPELSPALQAKLLRVLEDGLVLGLGESVAQTVDVRVIIASQQPLRSLVELGSLRRDLAARLDGLEARLPLLRERAADVAPLFAQFLAHHSGGRPPAVEPRLIEALSLHAWPQNVRELELLARRLLAVHGHEALLRRQHLPAELRALNDEMSKPARAATPEPRSRRDHDLSRMKQELDRNGGNLKAAAQVLGVSRQRLYRLMAGEEGDVAERAGAAREGDARREDA